MVEEGVLASRQRAVERRAASSGNSVSAQQIAAGGAVCDGSSVPAEIRTRLVEMLDHKHDTPLTPHVIDGPYWYDVDLVRDDLREDRPGILLSLAFRVLTRDDGGPARPVEGAVVELWHCDAGGIYSGFEEESSSLQPIPKGPDGLPDGPPPENFGAASTGRYSVGENQSVTTDDGTYLRGAQPTGADGIAWFTTIYPGWYISRSVHVHVKAHIDQHNELTGQMFFDDALNDEIFTTVWPYTEHTGRDTHNDDDFLYNETSQFTAVRDGDQVLAVMNLVVGERGANTEPTLILNWPPGTGPGSHVG